MTRLTKEREAEIRGINIEKFSPFDVREDLLAEIDALRGELNDAEQLLGQSSKASDYIENQRKGYRDLLEQCRHERDQLKADLFISNTKLATVDATTRMAANIQEIAIERDELKQKWETACWSRELHLKENDELKQYKIAALKELDQLKAENEKLRLFLNPMTGESIKIGKENQKLSSRIAKLREALNLFGHVGNDTKCCEDCTLRIEALARDDEQVMKL